MQQLTLKEIKIITLTSIGGALEFFEFTIYALFAHYISIHFFSNQGPINSLLMTFGVYALGYFARPIGGIVFGHLGDKYGRKNAFTLSILCMSVATLLIGCLPSYESIGLSAPILLILFRLLQGFSVGGEIAGAAVFTAEHLPVQRRGTGMGMVFTAITLGNTLGGVVGLILNYLLGDVIMLAWGWRLPFLIGFILGILSYFIRKKTSETPIFREMERKNILQLKPLFTLLQTSRILLITGFSLMSIPSTIIAFFLFLPVYLSVFLNFKIEQSFQLNILSFLVVSALTVVSGFISDFIDRKALVLMSCFTMAVLSYIAFYFFLKPEFSSIFVFVTLIGIGAGMINGCYVILITELFPANIRYSGTAISYNLGVAIFGGLGPFIFTFLTKEFHTIHAPFFYLMFSILLTGIAVLNIPQTIRKACEVY